MNQRIKLLAEQANITIRGHYDESGSTPLELEKFAELIVRECCKTLEEMHMWQSVNNQNYPSAWHDAVDQGIENIKEHFGVLE